MKTQLISAFAVFSLLVGCFATDATPPPSRFDLLHSADQLRQLQLFDSALESYRRAMIQFDSLGQSGKALECTVGMAYCWWALHKSDSAMVLCRRAIERFGNEADGKPRALADIHTILGNIHADKRTPDDFRTAMEHYRKACETLADNNAPTVDLVMAKERYGIANWLAGHYEEANHWYTRCLGEMPPVDSSNASSYAILYSRRGNVLESMGMLHEAASSVEKAYELSINYNLAKGVAEAELLNKLGRIQLKSGDPGQALVSYESALYLQTQYGEKQQKLTAMILSGLADCQCILGDDVLALSNYSKAREYWVEGNKDEVNGLQTLFRQMARCHLRHGRPATAAKLQAQALALIRKTYGPQSIAYMQVQEELGQSHQLTEEYEAATLNFRTARSVAEKLLDSRHPKQLEIQLELARTELLKGDLDASRLALHHIAASEALQPMLNFSLILHLRYERLNADLDRALFENGAGSAHLSEALAHYSNGIALLKSTQRQFLSEKSELHLQKTVKNLCEKALESCVELIDIDPALVSPDQILGFIEASSNVLLTGAGNNRRLLEKDILPAEQTARLVELQQQCRYYYHRMTAPPGDAGIAGGEEENWQLSYFEALRKLEKLNEELEAGFPHYQQHLVAPSVALIAAALDEGSAFMALFEGSAGLYRFSCTGSSCSFERLAAVSSYTPTLDSLLTILYSRPRRWQSDKDKNEQFRQFCQQSQKLHRLLIGRSLEHTGKLVVALSGRLNYLPLDILLERPPAESTLKHEDWRPLPYLLKSHAVQVVESAGLWLSAPGETPHTSQYFGFAPDFAEGNDKMPALPALKNRKEVTEAAKLWGGRTFTEGAASVENFWNVAGQSGVLHLGTHAQINSAFPGGSRFYFSGTDESYDHIAAWEIAGHYIPAALVVLSACNTGFGKLVSGDGVHSLSRAFRLAGADATLMSLWAESDQSGNELVIPFMSKLKDGMPKSRALQQAKLDYLESVKNDRATHPHYWASLVLTGNDEPLTMETDENIQTGMRGVWPVMFGLAMSVCLFLWLRGRSG